MCREEKTGGEWDRSDSRQERTSNTVNPTIDNNSECSSIMVH
jgi:hypothetical protein